NTKETLLWVRRALDVARSVHDPLTECYALFGIGTTLFSSGEQEGEATLEQSLQLALSQSFEEIAALAYVNLTVIQVENRAYAHATRYLKLGMVYCEERDLDDYGMALRANRAWARLYQGEWMDAQQDATAILSAPRLS